MVYFKVTDGVNTRKFKVNPGEVTYDQVKERIATLFPKALEGSQNVYLKYRDSDGDLITVSTNEEFQEAIAELPPEHVWKLHIHGGSRPAPKQRQRQIARATVPSSFFFQPTLSPYGGLLSDPWLGFGRRSYLSNPWSSLEREFDRMLGEHTEVLNSLRNTGEQQPQEAAAKAGPEGEGAVQTQSGESGAVAESSDGRMKFKNFGSWEPKEFDGPFGKGRIIGPVGYYVSWSSGPEEGEKSSEGEKPSEGNKEEGKGESADAAPKENVEGMETAQ